MVGLSGVVAGGFPGCGRHEQSAAVKPLWATTVALSGGVSGAMVVTGLVVFGGLIDVIDGVDGRRTLNRCEESLKRL